MCNLFVMFYTCINLGPHILLTHSHQHSLSGNNLSGVAVQFATQFGANATQ